MLKSLSELAELTGLGRPRIRSALADLQAVDGTKGAKLYQSHEALPLIFGQASKLNPQEERAALDRARREEVELRLAKQRRELVHVDAVREAFEPEFTKVRRYLLDLPSRMAPTVIGLGDLKAVEDALRDAAHQALDELGRGAHDRLAAGD